MMAKYAAIMILSAAADQAIKMMMRSRPMGTVLLRIPGIFEIMPCVNTGAAFSLFAGSPISLAVFSTVLVLAAGVYVKRTMNLTREAKTAFSVLLGGGFGNLLDRLFFGGVLDYIRLLFIRFPIFNLADIEITLSAAVLLALMLTNRLETHSGEGNGTKL